MPGKCWSICFSKMAKFMKAEAGYLMIQLEHFLTGVGYFFVLYLIGYATFLFASVVAGALHLYQRQRMYAMKNELTHEYYLPISIIVPAYNEEITIVEMIESLLALEYRLYEIIIVDDGSLDHTTDNVVKQYGMKKINRPIHRKIACEPQRAVYETRSYKVKLTLIQKENGGKGDALNMGINAAEYPYFICVDADSMLQCDSLERIIQPVLENDAVVAVGGLIRVAQCVKMEEGKVLGYHLPWNPIVCMQVMEYDRSFLASRILLDKFNGNLIISGAFGLFKKDIVVAAGGYDSETMGEDMELIVKLHVFCRNNNINYQIRYEPNAICWSQAPSSLKDLTKQRRRWYLGLFQSMTKHRQIFANLRFGLVSFLSYLYYLFYELLSPIIEVFGILTVVLAWWAGMINIRFMIAFFLIYAVYGSLLTITAFFQRIYTQNMKLSVPDVLKAIVMCLVEGVCFRFILAFIRITAFLGYKRKKSDWGQIEREKFNS